MFNLIVLLKNFEARASQRGATSGEQACRPVAPAGEFKLASARAETMLELEQKKKKEKKEKREMSLRLFLNS